VWIFLLEDGDGLVKRLTRLRMSIYETKSDVDDPKTMGKVEYANNGKTIYWRRTC
jgi:hypothetical protein